LRYKGITLVAGIEQGLDNGSLVFVPDKPEQGKETVWRCILVDEAIGNMMISGGGGGGRGTKWKVCLLFP
jgi:hypothetical protein